MNACGSQRRIMHVSHSLSKRGKKDYHSYLVRRSYRDDGGHGKHETVANISKLPMPAIEALALALWGLVAEQSVWRFADPVCCIPF